MLYLPMAALMADVSLPPPYLEIAVRVAGEGRPGCHGSAPQRGGQGCLPKFALQRGKGINASRVLGSIEFTEAAATRLTREEFALLAGHEIAHFYLDHQIGGPASELEADRLGSELACKAGFDPNAGVSLYRHFGSGGSHPHRQVRRQAVLGAACALSRRSVAERS